MEHEERERQRAREEAMSYVRHAYRLGQRLPDKESEISHWSDAAVLYSTFVLKGPWTIVKGLVGERAEQSIAEDPRCARWYAQRILRGRFSKSHRALRQDAYQAALYAVRVLGGRFVEAEPAIFGNEWAVRYYVAHLPALQHAFTKAAVSNGHAKLQWAVLCAYGETPELATSMTRSPRSARYYSKYKGLRVPSLEPMIASSQTGLISYLHMLDAWDCVNGSFDDRKALAVFSGLRRQYVEKAYETQNEYRHETGAHLRRALQALDIPVELFEVAMMLHSPQNYRQMCHMIDSLTQPSLHVAPAMDVFSTDMEAGVSL